MGGQGEGQSGDLRAGEWQLAVDYRYLHADHFFIGSKSVTPPAMYFGEPLIINIHSLNVNVTRALTDRISVRFTLPISYGSNSRFYPDTVRHLAQAGGIGDIGLVGAAWLWNPRMHAAGNLSLGLGVKLPTGNERALDDYFLADGSIVAHPVDQSIELGDGGWGVILQGQAYRRVGARGFAYATGSYLLSPRNQSDVTRAPAGQPNATVRISVPDVYTARVGVMYGVLRDQGLSVSLGARVDGIPYHDRIGQSDGFRRPGYIVFVDPGVTLVRGPNSVTVNTPIRSMVRLSRALTPTRGAGDLAAVLFFVGYTRRL